MKPAHIKIKFFLVSALALLMGQVVYGYTPPSAPASLEAPSCGIYSVLNLAIYLGHPLDKTAAAQLCEAYPKAELNLMDVQQAARKAGVKTEGVKATLMELQKRGEPFIAVLPNHFVFVECVEEAWVRYSDNVSSKIESRAEFEQQYQGKALVLAESIKGLHITPSIIDWGKVPSGTSEKQVQIELSNMGTGPLEIEDISTSCSCTVPSRWPRHILPGQKVPLQITLHLPVSGEFSQSVMIVSKGAIPSQRVSLFGLVESDVRLVPDQLGFGEVVMGKTIVKTLIVRDSDRKLPRPLQVSTSSKQLAARITPQGENTWEVEVILTAPLQAEEIDAALLISGVEKGSRVMRVPIQGRIVPMTRTRPEKVVFGSVAPEGASRRLQVFRQDNQPFEIMGVEAPPHLRCVVENPNQKRSEWNIRVSLDAAKAPAQVADEIVVRTRHDGQDENISVSVLALNEGNVTPLLPGAVEAAGLPRAEDNPQNEIALAKPLVQVGQPAPDFSATDMNGQPQSLADLKGKENLLLTFFPKCFTGGCANHLSSIRDLQKEFDAANTQILAVSVDAAEGEKGQKAFAAQWQLRFPMIPDEKRVLSKLFGAAQNDRQLSARMSILIDKAGIVRFIDTDVNVQTHGADMLAKINELGLK